MRNTSVPSQDQRLDIIKNNFDWIIDEQLMLDQFINKLQGNVMVYDSQVGNYVWIRDRKTIKFCNSKGANFIRLYLDSLLAKGVKTTVLDNADINYECYLTSKDMIQTLIHEAKSFGIKDPYIRPLKNMIVRFALVSMRKSRNAKMLDVIESTTQQRISQTNIQKEPEDEKKGFLSGLFKR